MPDAMAAAAATPAPPAPPPLAAIPAAAIPAPAPTPEKSGIAGTEGRLDFALLNIDLALPSKPPDLDPPAAGGSSSWPACAAILASALQNWSKAGWWADRRVDSMKRRSLCTLAVIVWTSAIAFSCLVVNFAINSGLGLALALPSATRRSYERRSVSRSVSFLMPASDSCATPCRARSASRHAALADSALACAASWKRPTLSSQSSPRELPSPPSNSSSASARSLNASAKAWAWYMLCV